MHAEIAFYRRLVSKTNGFRKLEKSIFNDKNLKRIFAAGLGVNSDRAADELINEFNRRTTVRFDIESAVSVGVYAALRAYADQLFDEVYEQTGAFSNITADFLRENANYLPVFQQLHSQVSKAQLKKIVGSVSDLHISRPASERLCLHLQRNAQSEAEISKVVVLQRMETTLEGIVRDLVGRLLLEEIVATALKDHGVPFLREEEYAGMGGVLYDNRADFVIPDAEKPLAFIEVRKSSSRHASLYAKDKMFSAINWKGRHKDLIAAIVVDGEWTNTTLQTMSRIFDYVIPIHESEKLAAYLKRACDGDTSIQKWIIHFKIHEYTTEKAQ